MRGSGSWSGLAPSQASVVTLGQWSGAWPGGTWAGGGGSKIKFHIFTGFSFHFHSLLPPERDKSHISWQWLLMVNINDGWYRHSVTAAWQQAWRYPLVLHVTRGRDMLRSTVDNYYSNHHPVWPDCWYERPIYLINKCWKAHVFCDNFLCPQFVPINGIRDGVTRKNTHIIICGIKKQFDCYQISYLDQE